MRISYLIYSIISIGQILLYSFSDIALSIKVGSNIIGK